MLPGWRVAKPTKSAFSTDPQDLIGSSEYNAFKIAAQGTSSVVITAGNYSATTTIAHGLAYTPSTLVYFGLDSGVRFLAGASSPVSGVGGYAWTDGTDITLFCNRPTNVGSLTVNVYYYVLIDPAA